MNLFSQKKQAKKTKDQDTGKYHLSLFLLFLLRE